MDPISLIDEFSITTVDGFPYSLITFFDLAEDFQKRLMLWVVAQAGENGVYPDNLVKLCDNALAYLIAGFMGMVSEEELRSIKVEAMPDV